MTTLKLIARPRGASHDPTKSLGDVNASTASAIPFRTVISFVSNSTYPARTTMALANTTGISGTFPPSILLKCDRPFYSAAPNVGDAKPGRSFQVTVERNQRVNVTFPSAMKSAVAAAPSNMPLYFTRMCV